MSTPFVFITTHKVDPARREELDRLNREYADFIRTNEPGMLAYHSYLDEGRSQLSLVQVHRDAGSADLHVQLGGPFIGRGVALAETVRIQVYGEPGPAVTTALQANADAGVEVVVARRGGEGFVR